MVDQIIDELKRFETNLKFKANEIKYSAEYLEMKDDLKIARKHLNSASKNVGKICSKLFKKERLTTLLNGQA
ncbi:MAG: hypothetical protein KDD94_10035 [Calditrichaeota bacterium]|nr:hypothetical protein [Calditrichota bacterium]